MKTHTTPEGINEAPKQVVPIGTYTTPEMEDWNKIKADIHSSFLVMLHSTLINTQTHKTAGEMAQAVIEVFEKYAFPVLEQKHQADIEKAVEAERERITNAIAKVYVNWRDRTDGRDDSYDDAFEDGYEVTKSRVLQALTPTKTDKTTEV